MIAYLREEGREWEIPEGESSVGRGLDCSFPLDAARYPQISRSHAKIILRDGVLTFRDENSANGTLKNGVRLSSGELRVGDTLELGAGGPVFEIRQPIDMFMQDPTPPRTPAAPIWDGPAGQEVTTVMVSRGLDGVPRVLPKAPKPEPVPEAAPVTRLVPSAEPSYPQEGATRMMPSAEPSYAQDGATRMMPSATRGGSGASKTVVYKQPEARSAPAPEPEDDHAFVPPPIPVRSSSYSAREDSDAELAIQRKLALLQTMLTVVIVAAVVLVGLLLYQDREIEQNRDAITALQRQANSSVSLLMPELDTRMKRLDDKLDSIDPKLQAAEDKMVERMNREMPAMMDKFMNQRLATMQTQHPELADPAALAGAAGALKQK